jgi:uncharacterized metal-binding protein YceD (DUF177 family)
MNGQIAPERPWSVSLAFADVPETGRQIDLAADEGTRAAVAEAAGIAGLPRLQASFDVTRHGAEGLRIVGRVSATVTQSCVVTLEPIESEIEEAVDLVFSPQADLDDAATEEPPEVLRDGVVDLGAIATEFLILGIDPYPRRPGAVFDAPAVGEQRSNPFAALAALKKDGNPEDR